MLWQPQFNTEDTHWILMMRSQTGTCACKTDLNIWKSLGFYLSFFSVKMHETVLNFISVVHVVISFNFSEPIYLEISKCIIVLFWSITQFHGDFLEVWQVLAAITLWWNIEPLQWIQPIASSQNVDIFEGCIWAKVIYIVLITSEQRDFPNWPFVEMILTFLAKIAFQKY